MQRNVAMNVTTGNDDGQPGTEDQTDPLTMMNGMV